MMKVDTKDWITFLSTAKSYMSEANIVIKDNMARIVGVDMTHTNMLAAAIPCEYEGETIIPVSLEKMVKALSAVGQDADMELTDGYLTLHGEHSKIKVPLLADVESKFRWPDKFAEAGPAQCDIDVSLLVPLISYGQYIGAGQARVVIADTRMNIIVGEVPETSEIQSPDTAVGESDCKLGLSYIELLLKNIKGGVLHVSGYGNNMPVLFSWSAGEGQYKVLMAPWIEE